jgi:outer membrane protein assembly factor BamB
MRVLLRSDLLSTRAIALAALLMLWSGASPTAAQEASVLTYHASSDRSGNFIVPALTWTKARSVHLDPGFRAQVSGHIYAQPLYWQKAGSKTGVVLVATEDDDVYALDGATGRQIWKQSLGIPVPLRSLPCGDIDPLGITGTPVIDPSREALYLDAFLERPYGPRHLVFALSLNDGSILPGWPIDVANALSADHRRFGARDQNQRGALAILDGTVYLPFGGHFGDCGSYHGWLVGISLDTPKNVRAWATRARGGGIWAPGGVSTNGQALYVATGNTFDATTWSDGEAVIHFAPDLQPITRKQDFFAPSNWHALDSRDADLGGTNPLLLKVRTGDVTQSLILALGKDGHAYILAANDLGGIGGDLAISTVSSEPIRTSPAAYPAPDGAFVAFQGKGTDCPTSARAGGDLTVLHIRAGSPPTITTAWCGAVSGRGSPIVTTTDGHSDPIVWMLGAEGDNQLHAFRGDTGQPLFTSGTLAGLRHFQTLIATQNHLYIGADDRVYAFAF